MNKPETILLEVHMDALRLWVSPDEKKNPFRQGHPKIEEARELLDRIAQAEASGEYQRIERFEGDPWEPEWNPKKKPFVYDILCRQLGEGNIIHLAGIQDNLCVPKIYDELVRRRMQVEIRNDLTMNDGFK